LRNSLAIKCQNMIMMLINSQQSSLAMMFIMYMFCNILNPFVHHYYPTMNIYCHQFLFHICYYCHLNLVFQRACLSCNLQAFNLRSTNEQSPGCQWRLEASKFEQINVITIKVVSNYFKVWLSLCIKLMIMPL